MNEQVKNYCIILGDNLPFLLGLEIPLRSKHNSILCYYFKNRDNQLCAFPLAGTYYENGDYTITESIRLNRVIPIENIRNDIYELIEVKNVALDRVFADRISEIEVSYILSQRQGAAFFMKQMGFPSECIEEYVNDGTVYLYNGFVKEKITEEKYPKLKRAIDYHSGNVYAVLPDFFDGIDSLLIWNPDNICERFIPMTKDERFGRISMLRCQNSKNTHKQFDIGIMTSNGGVWSIPKEVASMKEYKRNFPKLDD